LRQHFTRKVLHDQALFPVTGNYCRASTAARY
jgi:hypothetical protein